MGDAAGCCSSSWIQHCCQGDVVPNLRERVAAFEQCGTSVVEAEGAALTQAPLPKKWVFRTSDWVPDFLPMVASEMREEEEEGSLSTSVSEHAVHVLLDWVCCPVVGAVLHGAAVECDGCPDLDSSMTILTDTFRRA